MMALSQATDTRVMSPAKADFTANRTRSRDAAPVRRTVKDSARTGTVSRERVRAAVRAVCGAHA